MAITATEATATVREYFRQQCALGLSEFVVVGVIDDSRCDFIAIRCQERCVFDAALRGHEVFVSRADGSIKGIRPFKE